ncbi:M15 family metallopeptidase [Winogradskyella arenosi]|uniref:LAS superfamily LD-carboxypeptidase LdcB n=1 Tax=Winogradskyella arenosi TaxID=533325 RepID=A0A368ZDF9_9FLAO|nr:M15 family metallopeptidase [Winogradskyella arenosi]RCW91228.1 LAS superfamily LD-carboxypeptidase LdcB [Winogradskyella arenosi]
MRLLFVTLPIILTLLSCNTNKNDKALTETTTKPLEELPLQKPQIPISKALVLGMFNFRTDSTFTKVDPQYTSKTIYLNKEVDSAFVAMRKAAEHDGIYLKVISGTRNFSAQKAIWERKWKKYANLAPKERALKILEYSSMPGSSRHHWGTDLDLNNLTNSYFSSGEGLAIYQWLTTHANDFGFYQVYTTKNQGRTGYNLEKWHWSYLPIAQPYLEYYNAHITVSDIKGFEGADQAQAVDIINSYVNGISKKSKDATLTNS